MSIINNDDDKETVVNARTSAPGVALALVSALSFGLSGPMVKSLLDSGWSPGGALASRITCTAAILVALTLVVERRFPRLTRAEFAGAVLYGIVGVAIVQAGFMFALQTLSVGLTLMIQFLAPVLVIAWEWLAKGRVPSGLTMIGCAVALAGAAIIVDPAHGANLDAAGLAWAFLSTIGLAGFFVLSRPASGSVSNLSFGAIGMVAGGAVVGLAGVSGVLPLHVAADSTRLGPWWVPFALLVVVATAVPYLTAIASVSLVGPTLASIVLLAEVIFGATFAWILVAQPVSVIQAAGGAVLLAGITMAHLGSDRRTLRRQRDRKRALVDGTGGAVGIGRE